GFLVATRQAAANRSVVLRNPGGPRLIGDPVTGSQCGRQDVGKSIQYVVDFCVRGEPSSSDRRDSQAEGEQREDSEAGREGVSQSSTRSQLSMTSRRNACKALTGSQANAVI